MFLSLAKQIDKIEASIKAIRNGNVTVTIDLPIHDDIPNGFVSAPTNLDDKSGCFEKVIEAKDGKVTKKIRLNVPE